MTRNPHQTPADLGELFLALLEGEITQDQFRELQKCIKDDPETREYYYEFLMVYIGLGSYGHCGVSFFKYSDTADDYETILSRMAEEERVAPGIQVAKPVKVPESVEKTESYQSGRTFNKTSLITAIVSLAALIVIICCVNLLEPRQSVALLTDAMHAVWSSGSERYDRGDSFIRSHKGIELNSGIIKLKFEYGTEIILEGPCVFSCVSPEQLQLHSGKVFVRVPAGAEGFTVRTATSRIFDLGTEFGVDAGQDGKTSLHMFKGKALLMTASDKDNDTSMIAKAGQACQIDDMGNIQSIGLGRTEFVRQFDADENFVWRGEMWIDLADIVGGGNGFGTGHSASGVNWENGQIEKDSVDLNGGPKSVYVPANHNDYIDGVFVPDKETGFIVISSTGLLFKECPETSGDHFLNINNGISSVDLKLNHISYATAENPAITMHANAGITFDLGKLRARYPAFLITDFTSQLGMRDDQDSVNIARADIWVLVDGQVVYSQKDVTQAHLYEINVPLLPSSKYLTLVVTEGQGSEEMDGWFHRHIVGDWCIFGNPRLNFVDDK